MSSRFPITLIGGFLGAGKTSLLHSIVSEHEGGHLAVLVENPSPLNLDAKALRGLCGAMRRLQDAVLEIPSAGAEDQLAWLARALREIAQAGRFERVLIEVAGTSNPAWLAESFLPGGALSEWAELEQIICVVDALDYHRASLGAAKNDWSWQFLNAQIAGATLVVINKCDLVRELERSQIATSITSLHPEIRFVETAYGEVPSEVWAGAADPAAIRAALAHRQAFRFPAALPAADEAELSSALYRVHRPFHPARFWDWFNAEHPGLLRVKGLVWLASRHLYVGGVSRTRWQNSCGAAGIWWDALPREEWPQDEDSLRRMQDYWREPHGDRRQELVLIGDPTLLAGKARAQLDACLLTDAEYARPVAEWRSLPDPFPEWDVAS